jgi:hypothetical protein
MYCNGEDLFPVAGSSMIFDVQNSETANCIRSQWKEKVVTRQWQHRKTNKTSVGFSHPLDDASQQLRHGTSASKIPLQCLRRLCEHAARDVWCVDRIDDQQNAHIHNNRTTCPLCIGATG